MQPRRQQATHYWHPETGWSSEPEGATRRLVARVASQVTTVAENQMDERRGEGWAPGSDAGLSGEERGLVWHGWSGAIRGEPLIFLRGVRALDPILTDTLLEGLRPFGHDGEPLDDPALCGLRFALSAEHARLFSTRVRAAGGRIIRTEPDLGAITRHVENITTACETLEKLAAWAQDTLTAASKGIALDLHRVAESSRAAWDARQRASRAVTSLTATVGELSDNGHSLPERVEAQKIHDRGVVLAARTETAFALFRACEDEATRLLARLADDDDLHGTAGLETDGLEVLTQLCAQLTGAGQRARMEKGALVVHMGKADVVIRTDQVTIERPAE